MMLSRLTRRLVHRLSASSCPSCHAPLPTPLPACPKCSYISHIPANTPYHSIFGLHRDQNPFRVDPAQLTARFRDLQRVIHPDAWTVKGDNKQDIAASLSSLVNSAYKTLHQPLSRVEYILSQHGLQTNETDGLDDTAFIMEIMLARETLEDASSPEEAKSVQDENKAKIDSLLSQIDSLVANEDWQDLKAAAIKLKYLQGVADAAAAWPSRVLDH